jgi:hypothetical protein
MTYVNSSLQFLRGPPATSRHSARILRRMTAGFLTQSRKAAKAQRGLSVLAALRLCAFALKGPFVICVHPCPPSCPPQPCQGGSLGEGGCVICGPFRIRLRRAALRSLHCTPATSLHSAKISPRMMAGFSTQRRKDAEAQRASSLLASLRLRAFALKGPCLVRGIWGHLCSVLFGRGGPRCVLCGSIISVCGCQKPRLGSRSNQGRSGPIKANQV